MPELGVGVALGEDGNLLTDGDGVALRRGVLDAEGVGVAVGVRVTFGVTVGDGDRDEGEGEGEVVDVDDPCVPPESDGQ